MAEEQKDPMPFIGPGLPENGIYRNMMCELIKLKKDMGITSKKKDAFIRADVCFVDSLDDKGIYKGDTAILCKRETFEMVTIYHERLDILIRHIPVKILYNF